MVKVFFIDMILVRLVEHLSKVIGFFIVKKDYQLR